MQTEAQRAADKKYRQTEKGKEARRRQQARWRAAHPKYVRQWFLANKKRCAALTRKRYWENPDIRLLKCLRSRLYKAVFKNRGSVRGLLGCTIPELRAHLEAQFTPGMTWDNYGYFKDRPGWEIDHIRPCNTFDMRLRKNQRACFHYLNLRPLWGHHNRGRPSDGSDIKENP